MLILPGSPALSAFRKEKLLEALPQAEALSARFVHFVELSPTEGDAGLDERERQVLDSLLEYGPSLEDAAVEESGSETFVVVPRPGTVSPWSSKATDICHNAGLDKVARVERVATTWSWAQGQGQRDMGTSCGQGMDRLGLLLCSSSTSSCNSCDAFVPR